MLHSLVSCVHVPPLSAPTFTFSGTHVHWAAGVRVTAKAASWDAPQSHTRQAHETLARNLWSDLDVRAYVLTAVALVLQSEFSDGHPIQSISIRLNEGRQFWARNFKLAHVVSWVRPRPTFTPLPTCRELHAHVPVRISNQLLTLAPTLRLPTISFP